MDFIVIKGVFHRVGGGGSPENRGLKARRSLFCSLTVHPIVDPFL